MSNWIPVSDRLPRARGLANTGSGMRRVMALWRWLRRAEAEPSEWEMFV